MQEPAQTRSCIMSLTLFILLFGGLTIGPWFLMQHFYFERICQSYADAHHLENSRYSSAKRHSPEQCFFSGQRSVEVAQIVGWKHQVIRGLWMLYAPLGSFGLTFAILLAPWQKLKWPKNNRL